MSGFMQEQPDEDGKTMLVVAGCGLRRRLDIEGR
jgi:hypothetical protein